jgi:hypothetical protein
MSASEQWYVAVDDASVGPVSTELVARGIVHRRVPLEALVCRVGTSTWESLADVQAFHAAVVESYPPPPPGSEEAKQWLEHGFRFPHPGPLPSFDDDTGEAANDIEVDIDLGAPLDIDWSRRFHGEFLIDDTVELPDELALLESLSAASPETFRDDDAMWNLALCLIFGSDAVGHAAAGAFFDAVQGDRDRVAWMRRTLLDRGFVLVGVPASAGRRALERLSRVCPPSFAPELRCDAA